MCALDCCHHFSWGRAASICRAPADSASAELAFTDGIRLLLHTPHHRRHTYKPTARPLVQSFVENGRQVATITYPDDDPQFRLQYVGNVQRQRPHGRGELRWRRGNYVRFEGDFRAGEMREGVLCFGPHGRSRYVGELRQSRADGIGCLEPHENDDCVLARYEGGWRDGLKSGGGTAVFRNGDEYNGNWHNNRMSGEGLYTWADGTEFQGQFVDDEMHGDGVCGWPSQRAVRLSFTHSYPNAVRVAVRVLCGVLVLLTLMYVLPHLYDVAVPVDDGYGGDDAQDGYGRGADTQGHVDGAAAGVDDIPVYGSTAGANTGAGDAGDDFDGGGSASASDGTRTITQAELANMADWLAVWGEAPLGCSRDCECDPSLIENVVAQVAFVASRPWLWLWPWSSAQLQARARARREADVLAEEGLLGLHAAWNGTSDPAYLPSLAACPCDCGDDRGSTASLTSAAAGGTFGPSAGATGSGGGDDSGDPATRSRRAREVGVGAQGNADDGNLGIAWSLWSGTTAPGSPGSPRVSWMTALASEFDDGGDDGSDGLAYHKSVAEAEAARSAAASAGGNTAADEAGLDAAVATAASKADGLAAGAVGDGTPDTAGEADDDSAGATVSTVLILYLRLHMKRQLHYLRLGMIALFVMTGDLEDTLSALVWPFTCLLCRHFSKRGAGASVPDGTAFFLALYSATAAVLLTCVLIVVVVPEGFAEVVRLSCMEFVPDDDAAAAVDAARAIVAQARAALPA